MPLGESIFTNGVARPLLCNSQNTVILREAKNLHLADSYDKQVLRFPQNDREKYFFSIL